MLGNGLYVESNYIAFKPNILLAGNEVGTLVVLDAGAGFDGGAWAATGTGYLSFLRLGLLRCEAACAFDMSAAVPNATIFSGLRFYNSTLQPNAPLSFRRRADTTSYFALTLESTVCNSGSIAFQDLTSLTWSISGNNDAAVSIAYNSSSTYSSSQPLVSIAGLVQRAAFSIANYAAGVTVDVTATGYVNAGSGAMSIVHSSGATINTHGDVQSYGAINGGFAVSGSGSGSTQYLTLAPGLGYTPTTSGDWSPAPSNQQIANDQVASRLKSLESTPQRRFVLTFVGNATTSFALPTNITVLYFSGCGGGSSGAGNTPGNGYGGNAGAGMLDFPMFNTGTNFTVFVGAGGASGAASVSGESTTISNGPNTITLEGGQSTTGANRGGNIIFSGDTIVAGSAGGGSPGAAAVFNGLLYGGAGGGASNVGGVGLQGGYTPLFQGRANGGANSGNSQGGGGGSSIFGAGGAGATGSVSTDGSPGGPCAGGGGGGSDLVNPSNGGAGGNGLLYAYYYVA